MDVDWTSPEFLDRARAWTAEVLAGTGERLTGDWEQPHVRVWSSAVRFGSTAGPVWFKVDSTGIRHEPALLAALGRHVPDLVPEVLGVEVDEAWSLTRDAGPVLRLLAPPDELWDVWAAVLVRYADAQLALARAEVDVLATGLPVVSTATIPGQLAALTEELAAQPVEEGGLAPADADALRSALPEVQRWCDELAGLGVPDSVQHDDLHSANVCGDGDASAARIIDWGDASWGSPLGTMLATMNSIAWAAGLLVEGRPIEAPAVLRLRDAYLEPFTAYAGRDDLVRGVQLARRTGCVGKALSYRRALQDAPSTVQVELDFPERGWLLDLLDPAT